MVENNINPEGWDREKTILLVSIFIAGLCSLIYELLIGTTSTYFLGDGVKNFSLTIGFYMASMGLGSYLSRFLNKNLVEWFILIEVLLAFFGGLSVPILYVLFAADSGFIAGMLVSLIIIGVLTGFEIPFFLEF